MTKRKHPSGDFRPKLVLFAGPHKTGSSALQNFLVELSWNETLGDWKWPRDYDDKGFCELGEALTEEDVEASKKTLKSIRKDLEKLIRQGKSLVVATEGLDYLARFSSSPLAWQDVIGPRLEKYLIPKQVQDDIKVVITYRTSRTSQLVSIWKQQLAMSELGEDNELWRYQRKTISFRQEDEDEDSSPPPSLAQWLCQGEWEGKWEYYIDTLLESQMNPMGLAYGFQQHLHYDDVTIIDLGPSTTHLDLCSLTACQILHLPQCFVNGTFPLGHLLDDVELPVRPELPAPLGFTTEELDQMETTLRLMDCYYYCQMDRSRVEIMGVNDSMLSNVDGWKDCCQRPSEWLWTHAAVAELRQMSCRAFASGAARTDGPNGLTGAGPAAAAASGVSYDFNLEASLWRTRMWLFGVVTVCVCFLLGSRLKKKWYWRKIHHNNLGILGAKDE